MVGDADDGVGEGCVVNGVAVSVVEITSASVTAAMPSSLSRSSWRGTASTVE